jgi:O-acetyl-ADP-ribose deacetylase (regulator of RNase III)
MTKTDFNMRLWTDNGFVRILTTTEHGRSICLNKGDITHITCDAIVNAAHEALMGGGGVDGAIHRAAGPSLVQECKEITEVSTNVRCPTGEARITKAYNLPSKYVIHTVAPKFLGGIIRRSTGDMVTSGNKTFSLKIKDNLDARDKELEDCYLNCMALAREHGLESLAFPSLGTGGHAYPIQVAAPIAVRTVWEEMQRNGNMRVFMITFSEEDFRVYEEVFESFRERFEEYEQANA